MPVRMRTLVLLSVVVTNASCFPIPPRQMPCSSSTTSSDTARRVVSFNDFNGDIGDASSDEGHRLAHEFYEQLRERQDREQERLRQVERLEQVLKNSNVQRRSPKDGRMTPRQQQQQQQQHQDVIDFEKEFRKWTGQDQEEAATSAGLFARARSSVYSYPSAAAAAAARQSSQQREPPSSTRAAMLEDNLSLASSAERAVLFLLPYIFAAALVLSLAIGAGALEDASYDIFLDSTTLSETTTTTTTENLHMEDAVLSRIDMAEYVML